MGLGRLLILVALLAAPSSAAAATTSCAKTGRTVMKNATTRVYDVKERVYACHLKSRRRTFLTRRTPAPDDVEDHRGFIRARLAGRFVAFGDEFGCNRLGDCTGSVRVVDARTGRDLYDGASVIIPAGTVNAGRPPTLPALHLKRTGAAAFVIGPTSDQPYELWRLDADGVQRLDGGNIDPASLASNAARIYWTRDGQPFTATWR
jgi:hypothetical protein